jgi:hypothetical protein
MADSEKRSSSYKFSEHDYCPICGELAVGEKKHQCPKHILDEICKEEEARSEEFDNDDDKSYGERLDDAEFMMNYFEDDFGDEEE